MIIIGVHDGHNATAAIMKNGKVIACASEERFSRVKNDLCHPAKAIDSVLLQTGITPEQVDAVALCTKETDPLVARIKREALFTIPDYIREMHEYWKPLLYDGVVTDFWERMLELPRFAENGSPYKIDYINNLPRDEWPGAFNKERIRIIAEQLNIPENKIRLVDHHRSHASYAYHASPHDRNEKAVVVTADSWGDGCNASISVVSDNRIEEIHRTAMCHLARMYRWTTLLLGMKPNEHEYKVMGMAPYAKDYIRKPAYEIYKETLSVDGLDFRWNKKPDDMYFYFKDKFEGVRFDGIAGGIQLWLEEMLLEWITNIMTRTGADTLYYSGGLCMNVKANKVLVENDLIRKLHVPPSGGDESLAMGAAYLLAAENGVEPVPLENAYLGFTPTHEQALAVVEKLDTRDYTIFKSPEPELIVDFLLQGKVIGRCVGPMEFGARSLGNRAILCDPSKYENIRIINEKIKFRDFWMPFTPSILKERENDYIVNPKGIGVSYMTIAFGSTPLAREHIKAAIHPYDFTIRPQLVSRDDNPEYYDLIKCFESKTGIGALLNTSLNLHGDPIVCTVDDAMNTLINSGLDGMIFPGLLLMKQG